MKKFLMIAAMAAVSLTASAQVWLTGSVDFEIKKPKGQKTEYPFIVSPEVGYAFNDHWGLGLRLSYAGKGDEYSINPFVRYNFKAIGLLTFYLDGGIRYEDTFRGKSDYILNVGIAPGVKYALTPKWSVLASVGNIGYMYHKDKESTFGLRFYEGLALGLQYSF